MYSASSSFAALSGNSDLKLPSAFQEDDGDEEDKDDDEVSADTEDANSDTTEDKTSDTDEESDELEDEDEDEDEEDDVEPIDHLLKVKAAWFVKHHFLTFSTSRGRHFVPFLYISHLWFDHILSCLAHSVWFYCFLNLNNKILINAYL